METIDLDELPGRPREVIEKLAVGQSVILTKEGRTVATLWATPDRPTLRDLEPSSVGKVLRPYPDAADDLLEEMRGGS